jgi:hypothetical protein
MIYTKLRKKLKDAHDSLPELQSIRFHRSISWIKAAEDHEKEVDIKLITLWIAFNSLYAIENTKNESPFVATAARQYCLHAVMGWLAMKLFIV